MEVDVRIDVYCLSHPILSFFSSCPVLSGVVCGVDVDERDSTQTGRPAAQPKCHRIKLERTATTFILIGHPLAPANPLKGLQATAPAAAIFFKCSSRASWGFNLGRSRGSVTARLALLFRWGSRVYKLTYMPLYIHCTPLHCTAFCPKHAGPMCFSFTESCLSLGRILPCESRLVATLIYD